MHYANYEHNVNKLLIYFTFYYYMIHEGPDRGKGQRLLINYDIFHNIIQGTVALAPH